MQKLPRSYSLILCSIILFSITLSSILITSISAASTVIYVDSTNDLGPWNGTLSHPFKYIQDAVDAASTDATISIAAGTYLETIIIQKNLTLLGEQKDTTIIKGDSNGHVIHVKGSVGQPLTTQISSLTVKDAQGLGYDCIALSYVASGSITDTLLMNSAQSDGIQLDHCTGVTIANTQIKNNKGAGISITLSGSNTITNNIIQNNQKGIYIYLSSNNNIIKDNQILDNTQYGIYIVQSLNNYLYRNDFSDNGQNAQDSSTNFWSHTGVGNYWDDYDNYDEEPKDGIGDVPYSIPGGTNQDTFPLGYFLEETPPQTGNSPPTAYIPTIYPEISNSGDEITFSGGGTDSDGYIVAYYWRSNIDGFLNDQKSFSTTDLSPGTHQIFFKVRDNEGEWSNEKSTTITINNTENNAPIASIIYAKPEIITYGEVIYFNGLGIDSDGSISSYKWESNKDGVISTSKAFSSRLLSIGTHTISFSVQDNKGAWSSAAKSTVIVQLSSSSSDIIVDTGGPYIKNSLKVNFNASQSIGGIDFFWDFGDGDFGQGIATSHTYETPGNYTVKLTIRNEEGNISSASTYVNISEAALVNNVPQGLDALSFEIPMEIIVIIQIIIIVGCVGFFILWMKYK